MEDRLKSPQYRNWVKSHLALVTMKTAFQCYTENMVHSLLTNDEHTHVDEENTLLVLNKVSWNGKCWDLGELQECPMCHSLATKLVRYHLKSSEKNGMGWSNTVPKKPLGVWGIAKLFMPTNNQNAKSPDDTDLSALLHMVLNCGPSNLHKDKLRKVLTLRNNLMHSPNGYVNQKDCETYLKDILNLLKNAFYAQETSDEVKAKLKNAEIEITELQKKIITMDMLPDLAKKALESKKAYITNQIKSLSEGNDLSQFEEYIAMLMEIGGDLQFWHSHEQMRNEMEQNKDKVKNKNKLKQMKGDLQKLKDTNETLKQDMRQLFQTIKDDILDIEIKITSYQTKTPKQDTFQEVKDKLLKKIEDDYKNLENAQAIFKQYMERMFEQTNEHIQIKLDNYTAKAKHCMSQLIDLTRNLEPLANANENIAHNIKQIFEEFIDNIVSKEKEEHALTIKRQEELNEYFKYFEENHKKVKQSMLNIVGKYDSKMEGTKSQNKAKYIIQQIEKHSENSGKL